MSLELKTQRNGAYRKTWYGRYDVNGRKIFLNLGVKVLGTPPASRSMRDEGDTVFEKSRVAAQAKLDSIVEEVRKKGHAEHLVEKLYEIKTGEAIKSVKLEALPEEWMKIPRRSKRAGRYAAQCQSTLKRFVEFVQEQNPKAKELGQVTRTVAREFLESEELSSVAGKTWNDTMKLLRATFRHLLPAGAINPFVGLPTREEDTMFRIPFTPDELAAITETARADDFIRPIIITGMCTAMRRGDCCLLDWKAVDLANRFITVKTSKTGQTVSIPIFPLLYDELKARSLELSGKLAGYVFPEQAKMYLKKPDGITWRVKKVLAVAFGLVAGGGASRTGGVSHTGERKSAALPEVSEAEARRRGHEYIDGLGEGEKRDRMRKVFDAYMDRKKLPEILSVAGVSKGSVSGYLNEVEKAAKCKIVRGRPAGGSVTAAIKNDAGTLSAERKHGERTASVRDFHSFRVTWVTLALTAGVPLELVQKVTGHKTTDVVLKHYFQPGREAFREALQKAMPALLTNGQKGLLDNGPETTDQKQKVESKDQKSEVSAVWEKEKAEMRRIVAKMTAETWKRDRKLLMRLLNARREPNWDVVAGNDEMLK